MGIENFGLENQPLSFTPEEEMQLLNLEAQRSEILNRNVGKQLIEMSPEDLDLFNKIGEEEKIIEDVSKKRVGLK